MNSCCSLWLDELEVLIGGKESHEHWHLGDLNVSGLVHIEVTPGLGEVGVEICGEFSTADFLVGAENFGGSGLGSSFVHPESSSWGTFFILGLESKVFDHGSHEDIIIIGGESLWGNSGISGGTDGSRESRLEVISNFLKLDHSLIIIRAVALGIGLFHLHSRLVWRSSVGLLNGVLTVSSLDGRVGSVIVNGSERPDWLTSRGDTDEDGNSVGEFHSFNFMDYNSFDAKSIK